MFKIFREKLDIWKNSRRREILLNSFDICLFSRQSIFNGFLVELENLFGFEEKLPMHFKKYFVLYDGLYIEYKNVSENIFTQFLVILLMFV